MGWFCSTLLCRLVVCLLVVGFGCVWVCFVDGSDLVCLDALLLELLVSLGVGCALVACFCY